MKGFAGKILTIQFRLGKDNMGDAFFGEFRRLFCGSRPMNRPFFGLTLMDLARFFSEARAHVFEVLFDVMMDLEEHFLEFSRRRRGGLGRRRCFLLFRGGRWLFFLNMNSAGMG